MDRLLRACAIAIAVLIACTACGKECRDITCIDAGFGAPLVPGDATIHVVGESEACSMQSIRAMRGPRKPVDVIFVIDNSGSMSEEIAAIRDNINRDFAAIIEESGVEYRVIVLSRYGMDATGVCIEPPLARADCNAGLAETNSDVFFHYNQEIGSTDALCQVLTTLDRPDATGRAPGGWQMWLRPDAHKAFVVITDDSPLCIYQQGETPIQFGMPGVDPFEDALRFHQALLARSGEHFGIPPDIKYQFFSIIGLAPGAVASEPIFPHHDIVTAMCDTAPGAGPTYQALSIITDALRYPVCEGRSFDAVFNVLAQSVIQASQADCEFELPEAPQDQALLLPSINLKYVPGDGSEPRRFKQVASLAECKMQPAFFIGERIQLCPTACGQVKRDPNPAVEILYGCTGIPQ